MKLAIVIMMCIVALGLVGVGVYGFLFNLPMWGIPLILGLIVAAATERQL